MDALLPTSRYPGSLLVDPSQILAMLGLQGQQIQDQSGRTRPVNKAFSHDPKPLTAANYLVRPDQLAPGAADRVAQVASRIPHQLPPVGYHGPGAAARNATQSGATRGLDVPPTNLSANPALLPAGPQANTSGMPSINATVDPIDPFDPRNWQAIQAMAGQGAAPQPTPAPASQAPPIQTAPAGGPDPAAAIAALDPSFNAQAPTNTQPQIIPQPVAAAPQMNVAPQLNLTPLPPVHPTGGPMVRAPAPPPAQPAGGQVANLRFPVGGTPAISMMAPQGPPPVEMGGPTPAEAIAPAALPQNTIGHGFRAPTPAAPRMPAGPTPPPPIDDALAGAANDSFMNGPGPGATMPYPPPQLPSAPQPAAPASIPASPPTTVPDQGAAIPPAFRDDLIKAAMALSLQRNARMGGTPP